MHLPLLSVLGELKEEERLLFYSRGYEALKSLVLKHGGVEKTKEKARQEIERVLHFVRSFDTSGGIESLILKLINRES